MRRLAGALTLPIVVFALTRCVGDDPGTGSGAPTPDGGGPADSGGTTDSGPNDSAPSDAPADTNVDSGPPKPEGKIDWSTTFGVANGGVVVTTDSNNYVYAAIAFTGSNVMFGTTPLSSDGSNDIAVVKLDSTGAVQWAKRITGPGNERPAAISVDGSNLYVAGSFSGASVTADPSKTASATASAFNGFFVQMSTATGGAAWMTGMAPSSDSDLAAPARSLSVKARNGKVAFSFDFAGTIGSDTATFTSALVGTLDPSSGAATALQVFRSTDNAKRIRAFGGVDIDKDGSILVAGRTQAPAMYATHTSTSNAVSNSSGQGDRSGFVAKLASSGAVSWMRIYGSNATPPGGATPGGTVLSLAVDGDGNVYTGGTFAFSDFGTGALTSVGGGMADDSFLVKLDSAGLTKWVKQIGGTGAENPPSLAIDPWGQPIVSAYSTDGGSIDGTTFGAGSSIYIAKLSPVDGKALYVTGRSSGGFVNVGSVAASPTGYAILGGNFGSALDLKTNTSATTSNDAFIAGFTP